MKPCICQECKNLKISEVESDDMEDNIIEMQECEYDFPSEDCLTCESLVCEQTCDHFESHNTNEELQTAYCATCNKELKLSTLNDEEGDIYCVTCYLNQ